MKKLSMAAADDDLQKNKPLQKEIKEECVECRASLGSSSKARACFQKLN